MRLLIQLVSRPRRPLRVAVGRRCWFTNRLQERRIVGPSVSASTVPRTRAESSDTGARQAASFVAQPFWRGLRPAMTIAPSMCAISASTPDVALAVSPRMEPLASGKFAAFYAGSLLCVSILLLSSFIRSWGGVAHALLATRDRDSGFPARSSPATGERDRLDVEPARGEEP